MCDILQAFACILAALMYLQCHGNDLQEGQYVLQSAVLAVVVETVKRRKRFFSFVGEKNAGRGFAGRVFAGPGAFDLVLPVADFGYGQALCLQQAQDVERSQIALILLPPVVFGIGVIW